MRSPLKWQDMLPMAIALVFVIYGAYLVFVGPLVTIVTPDAGSSASREPNFAGLFPLIAGLLVIGGIRLGRERLVWAGGGLALVFTVMFLFSVGGLFIPVAVLLLASLVIRHAAAQRRISSR
jgi:uncharacterized membrane protein